MKIKKGIPLIDQHDKNGFYGGKFGGNYIAETLKRPIDDLTKLFQKYRKDRNFITERDNLYRNYVGTPTRFIKLENLTNYLGGAQIYAKMVSYANGGAHKIYNAITHAMLCKRANKKYICTDTGAGYNGKMFSMVAKKFGLGCKVFMGKRDIERQKPNCEAIKKNGAEIIQVNSGSKTLVDAVSECIRYWVSNCDKVHMGIGSLVGPNIFVKICGWSTAQISRELKAQLIEEFGEFGTDIFNGIIKKGMSKKMVKKSDQLSSRGPALKKDNEWYYNKDTASFGFDTILQFQGDVVDKVKNPKDVDGVWLDMTKEELTLACGKPDKKGNKSVSRTKVTEVWKFFGRINRQNTTSYKWEVRLVNDIVDSWKELE